MMILKRAREGRAEDYKKPPDLDILKPVLGEEVHGRNATLDEFVQELLIMHINLLLALYLV